METPPGKVIRSLRQALDMTQAEFARAAGWSASTISSWERGTTQPSRLAFKTVLAFAEERGVRYQPAKDPGAATGALAPTPGAANLPTLRLGSRLPVPLPAACDARDAGRAESFGSRRWTDVAADGPDALGVYEIPSSVDTRTASFDAHVGTFESPAAAAARPDWSIDARLRVEIGAGRGWARRAASVGAVVLALAVGAGVGALLRSGGAVSRVAAAPSTEPMPPPAESAPAPAPAVPVEALALAAAPPLGPAPYAAPMADDAPATRAALRPMPSPYSARLESIVALDGTRRATFRVGDRSIALVEGDQLGGRTVALIGNDEVTLVGGGVAARVRLGFETPLE